jgi:hypothetical protein
MLISVRNSTIDQLQVLIIHAKNGGESTIESVEIEELDQKAEEQSNSLQKY